MVNGNGNGDGNGGGSGRSQGRGRGLVIVKVMVATWRFHVVARRWWWHTCVGTCVYI